MTFDAAIKRALERNPTVEVAEADVHRAEALARQARATWLPTLNGNVTFTRLDDDRELNGRIALNANQLNANVVLTVPLIAPRQWVAHNRTKDAIEIARLTGADTRRVVALSTARAFLTVIAQHRVLAGSERALVAAKAHEEYANTRLGGGVGNKLDAVRAAQQRATVEARVRADTIALARAEEALGILVGEEGPVDSAEDPSLGTPPSVAAALEEAQAKRTDLRVERERVAVAGKAIRDTWTDYMPVLSAVAQPFYQNPPTFTIPQTGWQAQLVLSLPLYDGGLRYGLQDERHAVQEAARARVENVLRTVRADVRLGFESMRRSDEALVDSREAARLAHEALDLAQLAYRSGATSNIEVVDAERRAQDADIAAAIAEDASRQARLDLLTACGRFP